MVVLLKWEVVKRSKVIGWEWLGLKSGKRRTGARRGECNDHSIQIRKGKKKKRICMTNWSMRLQRERERKRTD